MIHDSFNVRIDYDDDSDHGNIDDFDDVHDIPLLDKEYKPLYEGSKKTSLYCIVDNELEGYEWSFKHINHIYRIIIKFICIPLIIVLLTQY